MLSRVADSIYWMNRYMERADSYARFIDVNLNLTLDLPPGMAEQWSPLVYTTGDNRLFSEISSEASREQVLRFLIQEERNPSSIRSCLLRARENARSVREHLSLELWEHINSCYIAVRDSTADIEAILREPVEFCQRIKRNHQLFLGLFDLTLSRGEAWYFGDIGRQAERAILWGTQRNDGLNTAFAKGLRAENQRALVELQGARDNFRRTRGQLVYEHDDREIERQNRVALRVQRHIVLHRAVIVLTPARVGHKRILLQEQAGNFL